MLGGGGLFCGCDLRKPEVHVPKCGWSLISNLNPDDQGFFNVHNYDLGKSGCFETLDDKDGVIDLSHQRQSGTFEHDL